MGPCNCVVSVVSAVSVVYWGYGGQKCAIGVDKAGGWVDPGADRGRAACLHLASGVCQDRRNGAVHLRAPTISQGCSPGKLHELH